VVARIEMGSVLNSDSNYLRAARVHAAQAVNNIRLTYGFVHVLSHEFECMTTNLTSEVVVRKYDQKLIGAGDNQIAYRLMPAKAENPSCFTCLTSNVLSASKSGVFTLSDYFSL
jgi:hypothetical protein